MVRYVVAPLPLIRRCAPPSPRSRGEEKRDVPRLREKEERDAPACGRRKERDAPIVARISFPFPRKLRVYCFSFSPRAGRRCRRRMRGAFRPGVSGSRDPAFRAPVADVGILGLATPVAPHPALRATFSPLAGRRKERRPPLAGRRERRGVPRLRGEGKEEVFPARGEKGKRDVPARGKKEGRDTSRARGRRKRETLPLAGELHHEIPSRKDRGFRRFPVCMKPRYPCPTSST